jgi:hypothetical protein
MITGDTQATNTPELVFATRVESVDSNTDQHPSPTTAV